MRRSALGIASAAMLAVTAPSGLAAAVFNPETFTLDNGMQVVVIPNHRAPIVTHMVWYKVGAADEVPGKSGLAHFLEHLMFKGTDTVPAGVFSETVARNGGQENAFTTKDYTAFYQTVARDRLPLMMKLEADRMSHLALAEDQVTPERSVIIEERRQRVDGEPRSILSEQVTAAQFLNHPYRIPTIGWEHEMRGLTREDAIAFYKTWYAPNNAVLVVAGDITAAELKPLAEEYYGVIPARAVPARNWPTEPPQRAARRLAMSDPGVSQPSWTRRYLAPSYVTAERPADPYALEVLDEILSGGATSRLYRALVVEGRLANAAGAWYDPLAIGPSTFGFYAVPAAHVAVERLEEAVDTEIDRLLAEGVTEEELARAKTRLAADSVYAQDSVTAPARLFGAALASGRTVDDVEAWPDRISAVTRDQVLAVARAVLDSDRSVTAVLTPAPRQMAQQEATQ